MYQSKINIFISAYAIITLSSTKNCRFFMFITQVIFMVNILI